MMKEEAKEGANIRMPEIKNLKVIGGDSDDDDEDEDDENDMNNNNNF